MQNNKSPLPVFIYGTLRPEQKNYRRFLAGRTRLEVSATIQGELLLQRQGDSKYPCLMPGSGRVQGDLVFLREDNWQRTLASLDKLEDYCEETDTGLYLRRRGVVTMDNGEKVTAWCYFWNGPTAGLEEIGEDFAAWMAAKKV